MDPQYCICGKECKKLFGKYIKTCGDLDCVIAARVRVKEFAPSRDKISWYDKHPEMLEAKRIRLHKEQKAIEDKCAAIDRKRTGLTFDRGKFLTREQIDAIAGEITHINDIPKDRQINYVINIIY